MNNHSNVTASSSLATACIPRADPDPYFDILRVCLYSAIILLSIFGNCSVIACVYKVKSMRTFTNILICNAAVADLLITMVPTVHEVVDILVYRGRWELGKFMCSFLYMCIYLSVAANILSLIFVTIDRYCAVLLPHKKYLQVAHLPYVISGVWIVAFLFSSPTTFIQKVVDTGDGNLACWELWPSPFDRKEAPKHYTIILFLFLYALPLSLMAFMYAAIALKLTEMTRKLSGCIWRRYQNHSSTEISSLNGGEVNINNNGSSCKGNATHMPSSRGQKRKNRVVKMLLIVVITFAICWLPVFVMQFFMFFFPYFEHCPYNMPREAIFVAYFMQYANSALNPLIYFGFSKSYRNALKKTFHFAS